MSDIELVITGVPLLPPSGGDEGSKRPSSHKVSVRMVCNFAVDINKFSLRTRRRSGRRRYLSPGLPTGPQLGAAPALTA